MTYMYIPYTYYICRTDIVYVVKALWMKIFTILYVYAKDFVNLACVYHGSNQHSSRKTGAFTAWSVSSEERC